MNSENSKTSDPHKLVLNLADKINLKSSAKCIDLSICYAWKNIKKLYKNKDYIISAPT